MSKKHRQKNGLRTCCVVCRVAAILLCANSSVLAGPWPQREGGALVITTLSYLEADNRLSNANPAMGDGHFFRLDLGLYAEFGVTDTLTVGASSRIEQVRLRGSIVQGETAGIADVELFARPVLWRNEDSILATQGTVIVPTGYNRDLNPALGDGAVGVEPRALFGHGFSLGSWPSFFDVEAAYRFRFGGPADQIRIDATLGSHPAGDWMLLLQSRNTISVRNQTNEDGFGPGLAGGHGTDYDLCTMTFSAVRDISPNWSVEIGGMSEIGGRNYNTGNGAFFSVWRKF